VFPKTEGSAGIKSMKNQGYNFLLLKSGFESLMNPTFELANKSKWIWEKRIFQAIQATQ